MNTRGLLKDTEQIISTDLIIPIYAENFGFIGVGTNSEYKILLENSNLSNPQKIELELESKITEKIISQTNLKFDTFNLTKVAIAKQKRKDLLILSGTANFDKIEVPLSIYLSFDQKYKNRIANSIKSMRTFSKIEGHQLPFGTVYLNDSICFVYQRNLFEILDDLLDSNNSQVCYIQNSNIKPFSKDCTQGVNKEEPNIKIWN